MIAPFEHRGYMGVVDTIDRQLGLLSGTVPGMRDVIHFEGKTMASAPKSFQAAIDDYLAFCRATDSTKRQE